MKHWGVNGARTYGYTSNIGCIINGYTPRQPQHGGFCGGVSRHSLLAKKGLNTGYIDNYPLFLRKHQRDGAFSTQKGAFKVYIEYQIPIRLGSFSNGTIGLDRSEERRVGQEV